MNQGFPSTTISWMLRVGVRSIANVQRGRAALHLGGLRFDEGLRCIELGLGAAVFGLRIAQGRTHRTLERRAVAGSSSYGLARANVRLVLE